MITYQGTLCYYYNWLFVEADPEIARYYRTLFTTSKFYCDKLQRTQKDSHITVISKHTVKPDPYHEKKYDGQAVEFTLDVSNPQDDGTYVWFPAVCDFAQTVRDELGLGLPYYPFHLTIGNRKGFAQ